VRLDEGSNINMGGSSGAGGSVVHFQSEDCCFDPLVSSLHMSECPLSRH